MKGDFIWASSKKKKKKKKKKVKNKELLNKILPFNPFWCRDNLHAHIAPISRLTSFVKYKKFLKFDKKERKEKWEWVKKMKKHDVNWHGVWHADLLMLSYGGQFPLPKNKKK